MRTRKEIESVIGAMIGDNVHSDKHLIKGNTALILEVLLDIRDLQEEQAHYLSKFTFSGESELLTK